MTQLTERLIPYRRSVRSSSGGPRRAAIWFACGLFGLIGTVQAQSDLYLSNQPIASGNSTYQASNSITAGNGFSVSGSAAVTFTAGNCVVLENGFQAIGGSAPITFQASVTGTGPCILPITITTNPPGQPITVDGAGFTTAHTFGWTAGSAHTISAAASIQGTGVQETFAGWSDGGAIAHTVIAGSAGLTYTANYATQYYLTTMALGGGTVTPPSGWYPANVPVVITATGNSGSAFSQFTGTLSGFSNQLTVPMSGPANETAHFSAIFTIQPAPPAMETVGLGGTATFTVLPPPGYTGVIVLVSIGAGCYTGGGTSVGGLNQPGWTQNADGSVTVTLTQDPNVFPKTSCITQGGGAPIFQLGITVYGAGQPANTQTLTAYMMVVSGPTLTLSASLLSKTASTATYMAGVTSQAFAGTVNLGIAGSSCASLLGPTPSMQLPSGVGKSATVTVSTAACAPGTNTTLTITAAGTPAGGGATVQAGSQTVPLKTAPAAAVMTSPPPGATIPGGATTFSWSAAPGMVNPQYTLYIGTTYGAADVYPPTNLGSALNTAQQPVTLPATYTPLYATLQTMVNGQSQYQFYSYTVNPSPSTQPLVLSSGPPVAAVSTSGQEVQYVYYFSGGDTGALTGVSTSIGGVNVRIVSTGPGVVVVGLSASPQTGSAARAAYRSRLMTPRPRVAQQGSLEFSGPWGALDEPAETLDGPTIDSVSPSEITAGQGASVLFDIYSPDVTTDIEGAWVTAQFSSSDGSYSESGGGGGTSNDMSVSFPTPTVSGDYCMQLVGPVCTQMADDEGGNDWRDW